MRETHRTIDRTAAEQRNICNNKEYIEHKGAAHRSLFAPFARQVWPSNLGCLGVTLVLQIARTAGIQLTTPSATCLAFAAMNCKRPPLQEGNLSDFFLGVTNITVLGW